MSGCWCSCALCINIRRLVIWCLVWVRFPCRNTALVHRQFFFRSSLGYFPVWSEDLACMWVKGNCSVICTLFKITFLVKWDERGKRPFLWPLASFPDRHTYSVHSVQYWYYLSSCLEQFYGDSSHQDQLVLRFAVWRMIRASLSNLWTQCWLEFNGAYLAFSLAQIPTRLGNQQTARSVVLAASTSKKTDILIEFVR